MKKLAQSALLAAILSLFLASAAAQTLTGTVTNGTGKPGVGDEVLFINLSNGMDVGAAPMRLGPASSARRSKTARPTDASPLFW